VHFCSEATGKGGFFRLKTGLHILHCNAPINGLPQDGGVGQPRGIRLSKALVGWDFDIKVERIWEWVVSGVPSWKIPRVSHIQGWLNER